MKTIALGCVACTLLLLSNEGDAQSLTRSGVIHFHGAIVEPSYEISPATTLSVSASTELIEVEPGVVIAVNRAFRGANGSEPVFSTRFEALKETPPSDTKLSEGKRGVLTISYR